MKTAAYNLKQNNQSKFFYAFCYPLSATGLCVCVCVFVSFLMIKSDVFVSALKIDGYKKINV